MSQIQPINQNQSVYNAVKIRIDNPQAYMPSKVKNPDGNSEFNAVNLEITEPELKPVKNPIYAYPVSPEVVTYEQAGIAPMDIPMLPVTYKTSYINNRTYINAELDSPAKKNIETVQVPEPDVTTTEEEKNLAFHGINFKSAPKPDIAAPAEMKSAVDTDKVIKALESSDYDTQAKQMEEIVASILKDKNNAVPYITTSVFTTLVNIMEKDTSGLEGPTEEQTEIRKKIILNELLREQQLAENKKPEEIKLPFELTDSDYAKASKLSTLEMAERNKEYAIYTTATLAKAYAEDFEAKTGNVVPLTDLPGVSNIVDVLKKSENPSLKAAALETLLYINRAEYKDEISAIFKIAATDKQKMVSQMAAAGLAFMEGKLN